MAFNRPTLSALIDRIGTDISTRLVNAATLRPGSILGVIARVLAGLAHGLYGYVSWTEKQILPDTADDDMLERHAFWKANGMTRNLAKAAKGNVTFTGVDTTVIPAGTEIQTTDGVAYTTDIDATIAAGTATTAVTAIESANTGNQTAGVILTLSTPIDDINSNATVAVGGLTGGIDKETNTSLLERLREYVRAAPAGGKKSDYVIWAREVAGVTRAWSYPLEDGDGKVKVRFMMDDAYADGIPLAGDVTTVQNYIDTKAPAGIVPTVAAPVAVVHDMTISLTPNTAAVQAAVQAELEDLFRREAEPGGTILLSHIDEAISIAEGETDHVLTAPVADLTHTASQIGVLGAITWA